MRFLIEAAILDRKETPLLNKLNHVSWSDLSKLRPEFDNLSSDLKKNMYIQQLLKKSNNYSILQSALNQYITGIQQSELDSDYAKYVLNIKRKLNPEIAEIIYKLYANGNLNPIGVNTQWLEDNSLYTESISDIVDKIKYLSFVTNPKFANKYKNVKMSLDDMRYKDKRLKSSWDMEKQINKWAEQEDGESLGKTTIQKLIKKVIPNYDAPNAFKDFISKNFTSHGKLGTWANNQIKQEIKDNKFNKEIENMLDDDIKYDYDLEPEENLINYASSIIMKTTSLFGK